MAKVEYEESFVPFSKVRDGELIPTLNALGEQGWTVFHLHELVINKVMGFMVYMRREADADTLVQGGYTAVIPNAGP